LDIGLQNSYINQLFADALEKSQAMRVGLLTALDVDRRLFTAAGEPAPQKAKGAFRVLVASVAADGVLTDGERRQIVGFLEEHGLTLQPPVTGAKAVDIDGIDV
jgi:hypothetical protein